MNQHKIKSSPPKPNKSPAIPAATHGVKDIIRRLMRECGNIKEAELARQTCLPQATINRVLLGGTVDPRVSTLITLANFFKISVEQLIGAEPLDQMRIHGTYCSSKEASNAVPLITWEKIANWDKLKSEINPVNHKDWIVTETRIAKDSFALKSMPSLEPIFPQDSVLIFSTAKSYLDGAYVLVNMNNNVILKKIIITGEGIYLEHLFKKDMPVTLLDKKYKILGYLVETRMYF